MVKGFKTHGELVALMESRGITTDSKTIGIIKRESYYAIINGYKSPFLDREAMQHTAEDVYREGTTFSQIYELFLFDRDMRSLIFPYLTRVESILKNAVVYSFCERNTSPTAYLDRENYTTAKDMLFPKTFAGSKRDEHRKNLATLMKILNGKLAINKRTRPFVKHYLEAYGMVPLWVLQNDLTFGNMEHFYQLQKRGVQNDACKIVGEVSGNSQRITPHDLLRVFGVLVEFRNMCAHDERIYCAEVKGARLDGALSLIQLVLPRDEMIELALSYRALVGEYLSKANGPILQSVLSDINMLAPNIEADAAAMSAASDPL